MELTGEETRLFTFLVKVVSESKSNTIIRVAGGWVRDKLLSRTSDDIDIVLDNLTGRDFATLLNKHEKKHGHDVHKVGIIKANPEKSKHLETATVQIGQKWIDVVNLRAETYTENSRIPEMTFGTPLQDAERRDFTFNSLFYNVTEDTIEDFTGKGLEDLRNQIVRTPLEPKITFLDDPIRVLRAIRFCARFEFKFAESLSTGMDDQAVRDALAIKVSRERVGKEVLGMITGTSAHPERAFELMHTHDVLRCIFSPMTDKELCDIDGNALTLEKIDAVLWKQSNAFVQQMHKVIVKRQEGVDEEGVRLRILSAALLPMAHMYHRGKKMKMIHLPELIIGESLKLPKKDASTISWTLSQYEKFQTLASSNEKDRVTVGLLLRSIGRLWPVYSDVGCIAECLSSGLDFETEIWPKYAAFSQWVLDNGLQDVCTMKPIVSGSDIIAACQIKKGPLIGTYTNEAMKWQLQYPKGEKEACLEYLKTLHLKKESAS